MNSRQKQTLTRNLSLKIRDAEQLFNCTLPVDDRVFLLNTCLTVVDSLIAKFIRGSKEHGGSVLDRSALPELHAELLDSIVYLYVLRQQLKTISNETPNL